MTSASPRHLRWEDIPAEQLSPLLERQFISGAQITFAKLHLKQGCTVPQHSHPNEQVSTILSGALRFTLDPDGKAEQVVLRPGEVLVIPANLPHSAEALEDSVNLDVFAPPREDWASGADAYLRNSASRT